jgi:hypothetical protein
MSAFGGGADISECRCAISRRVCAVNNNMPVELPVGELSG